MKNTRKEASLLLAAIILLTSCGKTEKSEETYANTTWHMDTFYSYTLYGPDGEETFKMLEEVVSRGEEVFDCYSSASELYSVNTSSSEEKIEVSSDLYEVLTASITGFYETDGCFDPTIGTVSVLWGFSTDHPSVPEEEELQSALSHVDASKLKLTEKGGKWYLTRKPGQIIDLGGIAKGYVLAQMKEVLKNSSVNSAVLSAGGNVLLYGNRKFSVGIRRPSKDAIDPICVFLLEDCVVSTTGSYERYFVEDGVTYCHILDPKTGKCVSGEMVSLSVIADDPTEADLLSTAYFVKGLEATKEAIIRGEIEAVILTKDQQILCSSFLAETLKEGSIAEGWTLEVLDGE
ncbi:MAG: FAD:protein FMN transferase [Oscillospiraceae bacterium]|nr:FAD:protein FMN transferase [Oscillospiraceae bacterium]